MKCQTCGKRWIHSVDSITKKLSKYLWKPNCKCYPEDFVLIQLKS